MMRLPLGLDTRLPHEGCFSLQINAGSCADLELSCSHLGVHLHAKVLSKEQ